MADTINLETIQAGVLYRAARYIFQYADAIGAVDKVPLNEVDECGGHKKAVHGVHPMHRIMRFSFNAVADRRPVALGYRRAGIRIVGARLAATDRSEKAQNTDWVKFQFSP